MSDLLDVNGNEIKSEREEVVVEVTEDLIDEDADLDEEEEVDDMKAAYFVGMKNNGQIIFEPKPNSGLLELLGLNQYVAAQLDLSLQSANGVGAPIMAQQLGQLLKGMNVVLNLLTQQQGHNITKK